MIKYDNYYVNKEQYTIVYNFINNPQILQSIDKLTTYEFISYKSRVMYKLEETVIEKLEELKYPIKYIDELEHYKIELERMSTELQNQKKLNSELSNGLINSLLTKSKNTVNEIYSTPYKYNMYN